MSIRSTYGATITSVLVATALAGVVAAVVSQLITNQSKVMRTLTLREERENLLKHYRNTLMAGWDNTLTNGCADLYDRDGRVVVPSGGVKSKSDNLYTFASDGWWEVIFTCGGKSGSIFASDKYETIDGSGLHSETHREVTLTVNFLKDDHPHISTRLAPRVEKFYMHQNRRRKIDATDCANESNRTRRNSYQPDIDSVPASLWGGSTPDALTGFALYKGTGAIIQYDFNTNYVKCSQVPLVKQPTNLCEYDAAIIGFWGTMEGGSGYPYVRGEYVCSHDGGTGMPTPDPVTGIRYHPRVDRALPERYITVYRGYDGDDDHIGNFGISGCQATSTPNQITYVSYIDGKGTAYCQRTRHVVENNVSCSTYPHPSVSAASYNASYQEPDGIIDAWGDTSNPLGNGADEKNWQKEIEDAISAAHARGHSPPGIPAGYFTRIERDTTWTLGRGGFLEFQSFGDLTKQPGLLVSKTETPDCSEPGFHKGPIGSRGDPGSNGSKRGDKGDPGIAHTPTNTITCWSGSPCPP